MPYDIHQVGGIERHVQVLATALHHLQRDNLTIILAYRRRGHLWTMIDVASWLAEAHCGQGYPHYSYLVPGEQPLSFRQGDLLHIHGLARLSFPRLIRRLPSSVPIVLSTHGSYWSELEGTIGVRSAMRVEFDRLFTPPFLRRCAVILVASETEADVMQRLLRRHLISTPIEVRPLPVPEALPSTCASIGTARSNRLLAVGRHDRIKGFKLLATTVIANSDLPGCDIVGPTGNATRVLRRISAQAANRVSLLPAVRDGGEMARLMQQATAVVVPSRFESFSLVAHEAIALDTPVIISDRASAALPNAAVQTFPVGNPAALAEQIRRVPVVGHAPATRQARAHVRATISTPAVYALRLLDIYEAAFQTRRQ